MFDTRALPDDHFGRWSDLRLMLATGVGVRRNPRAEVGIANIVSRASDGRRLIEVPALDVEDDGGYLRHQRHGGHAHIIRVVYPDIPSSPYELDIADYRRLQTARLELEATAIRRYWRGHKLTATPVPVEHVSPFGSDRFRPFDPLPAYDGIGSSSLITYISR